MNFENSQPEVPKWSACPRCGSDCLEILRTHSHCVDCNYSPQPEEEVAVPSWVHDYLKSTSRRTVDVETNSNLKNELKIAV